MESSMNRSKHADPKVEGKLIRNGRFYCLPPIDVDSLLVSFDLGNSEVDCMLCKILLIILCITYYHNDCS